MRLHDELYFEIELKGIKEELVRFVKFILSGELDDLLEITSDYIVYDDYFDDAPSDETTSITIVNDEYGIEVDSFNPEEFLNMFCKAAENFDVTGHFYDIDDEEYRFESPKGDPCYTDAENVVYNDELDEAAYNEELAAKDDYEE